MSTSLEIGTEYLAYCRRRLLNEYFPRVRECINTLSDEEIWWRPNEESNSIGNLILHLCGNVRQWIVHGIGGEEDVRIRRAEFSERGPISKDELIKKLEVTLRSADSVLEKFAGTQLLEVRHIQFYDITCLDAISHVVEHFAQHTAQIIYITKFRKEGGLDFFASYFPSKESSSTL